MLLFVLLLVGLLKDYLRELPECLLTSQAYQVAERALTKDTTQDADLDSMEVVNEFVAKLQPRQQVWCIAYYISKSVTRSGAMFPGFLYKYSQNQIQAASIFVLHALFKLMFGSQDPTWSELSDHFM